MDETSIFFFSIIFVTEDGFHAVTTLVILKIMQMDARHEKEQHN